MGKSTVQVINFSGDKPERLEVTDVDRSVHGVECFEVGAPNFLLFIPYTSIRMISTKIAE